MNRPITSNDTESVIKKKKCPTSKSPRPDGFTGELNQPFRKELTPILLKQFQKIVEKGTLLNSFYMASITLIPKPDKDITRKRKLQANITNEHRYQNPQQNIRKPNPKIH